MSGGTKKKMMMVALFAYSPEVLILDESLNDIDFDAKELLANEFLNILNKKETVILSTHIKDILKNIDCNTIKIKDGKLTSLAKQISL